ncbi:MAG TPA: FAD-binding oxidoreductase [Nocardioides sp.]|uniref:FAD-binding oxidoreductase n=1 Tax=uncultured Nocardioides sp. TaxID=198441 RepID=UPI000ECCF326|nr:FAD-binding oxidoreductase [uncultured Nocardioides sp.]HCB03065.1 FAD-linked oxidase [Nocardioides sp.]HRD60486.1 FAD-binding oxidoreductase [Nocardioides sp.]HRI94447.1 FAD-binding oxidoreductase [Nocardioides sp.]HRK45176.1 FAD-binding oxidoreductase [Nocardioides sp.]
MSHGTAWQSHEAAVARLKASYDEIPAGAPVRLAKKTSNLFRPRAATASKGLDVSGLDGVIEVDVEARTADVQGMCTYEHLVDATLPHGLIPYVVPQLKTITLGGAVTGLGIESTSFRSGLPHESVLEMDVFTGAGEVVTTRPAPDEHSELFDTFPNSYGSLGYATRIRIKLEPVPDRVELRHVRFDDAGLLSKTIAEIVETREYDGVQVDGLDGVAFEPDEYYLTLARWSDGGAGTEAPSDYTGQQIYYRSIQQRASSGMGRDVLTMYDYLWRWDTDWFWCSGAFGVQNPTVRRLWPKRWRRSDVYHHLIGLNHRTGFMDWVDRRKGRPQREQVVQDIEVPVERLPEFLDWFDAEVGMRPVWLCPLVSPGTTDGAQWPTYPLRPGTTYVNVGFWGTVHVGPEAPDAPLNRAIEGKVQELGGHKSLYSEAFYDRETFDRLYDGPHLAAVKQRYDPDDRLLSLYDKAVRDR